MKALESNNASKPQAAITAESAEQALQIVDTLVTELKQTVIASAQAGDSFDQTERKIHQSLRVIGGQLVNAFIQLQGDGDLGPEIKTEDAKSLYRSDKPVKTTVRSIFGIHRFEQYTYAPGPKKTVELRPISARMSLPVQQWSFLLQEFSQMLAVDSPYSTAMENLGRLLGGTFSVDTAERINMELGQAADSFLKKLPIPARESEATLLVVSADGKGVPLVKEDAAKVAAFEQAKKNPGNRRMATVASVYTVEPHVRTAEEITAALFRDEPDEDAEKPKRPRPQNKNTTAYLPDVEDNGEGKEVKISGIHFAMSWIMLQVHARIRPDQVMVVLMDGQPSLWSTLQLHFTFNAKTVPILDIIHVLTYIWEASGLFETTEAGRRAFTRARLLRILQGDIGGVIRGLRLMGVRRKLTGKRKKDLKRICGYLETNQDRMKYDEYLRAGYPIASGVIEGACRHLVKDRMERSGMRWTLEGARNMLYVRSAFQGDHWETFLSRRIEEEVAQIHKHRALLNDYQPLMIAC